MSKAELQNKIYDLEMQLRMSKACSDELRAEVDRLHNGIQEALDKPTVVAGQKDAAILAAIVSRWPDFMMVNTEEVKRRGRFEVYPDKTEIFVWDGEPLLKFWPMELNMENGKITATQAYQVLSR